MHLMSLPTRSWWPASRRGPWRQVVAAEAAGLQMVSYHQLFAKGAPILNPRLGRGQEAREVCCGELKEHQRAVEDQKEKELGSVHTGKNRKVSVHFGKGAKPSVLCPV